MLDPTHPDTPSASAAYPSRERGLALVQSGLALFPCDPATKHPLLSKEGGGNGYKDATRDPAQVRQWVEEYLHCRWGVCPGRGEFRTVVLDIDCKSGAKGYASLARLEAEGLAPSTFTVKTPSGGEHRWFKVPASAPEIGNHQIAPGIDVRADRGYVVWWHDGPPPDEWEFTEAPAALIARLGKAQERAEDAGEWLVEPDLPANVERTKAFLEATEPAIEGVENSRGVTGGLWTVETAMCVKDLGVSAETCLELMLETGWNDRCLPPWDPEDLERQIANGYRYAKRPAGTDAISGDTFTRMAEMARAQALPVDQAMRFVTLDEVCARPRRKAIIKSILYEGTVSFIFGRWGSFKSFIALDQAAHVALGLDWCGNRVREPQDVLFIAAEGEDGIRDRILAWQRHTDNPQPARLRLLAFPGGFQLSDPGHVRLLRAALPHYAAQGFRPAVLYVDTLAATTSDLNESTAEDMGPVLRICRQLADNAAVVLIDHTGKDDPDGKKGPRGWSGKLGNADAAFLVKADDGAYTAMMSPYKPPKDGKRPAPIGFVGTEVVLGEDEDGDPITSLAFNHAPGIEVRHRDVLDECTHEMRVQAFLALVCDTAVKSGVMAEAMAKKMVPEDASHNTLGLEIKKIRAWLSNIARGHGRKAPAVLACKVPELKITEWRKAATTPDREQS